MMDIIVSHLNADFDAFASMVAAKKLFTKAEIVFPGSQEKKLRDFIEYFHPVAFKKLKDIELDKVKRLIIVDTKSPDRLGPLSALLGKPGVVVHIYDHHRRFDGDITGAVEVIEDVGATATIFAEILMKKRLHPTPMEATILCLGIYEETGNLLFPTTTDRDFKALSYLIKHGASINIVSSYMKHELSIEELELLNELARTSKETVIGGIRVVLAKASLTSYLGDAAQIAHRMIDMMETDALILMLRMEDKVVMVGRSRVPELNVAELLSEFGGGGHPSAASATVKDIPLELLEEKALAYLSASIKPEKSALDVMTKPVISITTDNTLKEAESSLTKYGINVLPVTKNGLYKGILTREIVEKALFHGFGKSKVMDFTTTDALTAAKDTPVRNVETMMIEHNQRFMPVIEKGEIIGAITRTDLLRVMYEDYLRRSNISAPPSEIRSASRKNLTHLLKSRFPSKIFDMLRLSGDTAEDMGFTAYLVGGSVRDLIRGEENLDLDVVIEGDGILFAGELAKRLDARASIHERFQTAKLLKDDVKLDIATARTEYYTSPAALPTVETSSIKKDLYRRDFTINTLAVKLNPGDFGNLVDFFGGQRDIKEKSIRVLHNLSFIEDPTRAIRAMRFAERFGFRLSKHTENLIKSALKMNLFDRLSGSRLYEELLLAFGEAEPVKVIKRLSDYRLLGVIHPSLSMTEELYRLLVSVHDALLWTELSFIEEKPDRGTLYLMALLSFLKDEDKEEALQRLSASEKKRASVINGIRDAKIIIKTLPLEDPAAIYDALNPVGLDAILLCMALTDRQEIKKDISRFLLKIKKTRPILTGNDLKAMGVEPGPVYSKILGGLLREKLRGRLPTREDEENYARLHS